MKLVKDEVRDEVAQDNYMKADNFFSKNNSRKTTKVIWSKKSRKHKRFFCRFGSPNRMLPPVLRLSQHQFRYAFLRFRLRRACAASASLLKSSNARLHDAFVIIFSENYQFFQIFLLKNSGCMAKTMQHFYKNAGRGRRGRSPLYTSHIC